MCTYLDHEEDGRGEEEGEELVQARARPDARQLHGLGERVHVVVLCLFVFVGRVVLNVGIQLSWRPTAFVRYLVGEADGDELADGLGLRRAQVLVVGQGLAPVPCGIVW